MFRTSDAPCSGDATTGGKTSHRYRRSAAIDDLTTIDGLEACEACEAALLSEKKPL